MRPPLHGDVVSVARVLYGVATHRRSWVLCRLFREAAAAHEWVTDTGRAHPRWGDGSLMTTALRRRPPSEPSLGDPEYCACLAMTFAALARLGGYPVVQETQRGTVGSSSSRAGSRSSPQS